VIFPFNGGLREGRNGMEGGQREEELMVWPILSPVRLWRHHKEGIIPKEGSYKGSHEGDTVFVYWTSGEKMEGRWTIIFNE